MYDINTFCNLFKMFLSSAKCFSIIIEKFKKFSTAFAFCFDIYLSGPPKTDDNVSSTNDIIDLRKSDRLLRLFDTERSFFTTRLILKLSLLRLRIFCVVRYIIWGLIVVVIFGASFNCCFACPKDSNTDFFKFALNSST